MLTHGMAAVTNGGSIEAREAGVTPIGVDEALDRILGAFSALPADTLVPLDALGLVLAESIVAVGNVPPFRNSAMDGFAVRASETVGASRERPVEMLVDGTVAAGSPPGRRLEAGTAARIMTGAPLPEGADAVVRFEDTDEGDRTGNSLSRKPGWAAIYKPAIVTENVREAGEDIRTGQTLLEAGARLRPPDIGLLAAVNRSRVRVHRRPRVAILSTGDEVVDVGSTLGPGQIRDSNGATLAAMVQYESAVPVELGIARDTSDELAGKLSDLDAVDMIVTSGGVSAGDFDFVKDVLRAKGEVSIWQVRMKPGKPLAFGFIGRTPLLGLPGNPVAAAVSFQLFGRPAIRKMLGWRDVSPSTVAATLCERVENAGRRRHFVRARVERSDTGGFSVRPVGDQGAGVLTSFAVANGLVVVPEHQAVLERGSVVQVQILDWDLATLHR